MLHDIHIRSEARLLVWVFGLSGATPVCDKSRELAEVSVEQSTVSGTVSWLHSVSDSSAVNVRLGDIRISRLNLHCYRVVL